MRFFADAVLHLGYEELHASAAPQRAFCFDPATRAIFRPSDPFAPLALRDYASVAAEARHLAASWVRSRRNGAPRQPIFRIPGLRACGLVVHARDNTTVIVQRRPRRVWKLVRSASDAPLLERERQAARLAPMLAPGVLDWHQPSETAPGYVALEYMLDTEPIAARDLPDALRAITPALVAASRAAGVIPASLDEAEDEVQRGEAVLAGLDASPFTSAAADVLRSLRALVMRYASPRPDLYRTFVHGDIQTSNFRRSARRIALIDWANGGTHNVLFDPFIVELFSPTPSVWMDVLVNGAITDPGRGFRGWLPLYLDVLTRETGVTLRGTDIAAGLVCSMAEKTSAIVARHAGTDEARGLHSLGRVQRLLSIGSGSGG